jgi:hypothetical protein
MTLNMILAFITVFSFLFLIFQLLYGPKLKWLHDPEPFALVFFYIGLHLVAGITYGFMWLCEWINFTAGAFLFWAVTAMSIILASTFWTLFSRFTAYLAKRPRYKHQLQK